MSYPDGCILCFSSLTFESCIAAREIPYYLIIPWNDKKGRTAHLQGNLIEVILHLVSWYSSIKKNFLESGDTFSRHASLWVGVGLGLFL
jgi:hypothetical protein